MNSTISGPTYSTNSTATAVAAFMKTLTVPVIDRGTRGNASTPMTARELLDLYPSIFGNDTKPRKQLWNLRVLFAGRPSTSHA